MPLYTALAGGGMIVTLIYGLNGLIFLAVCFGVYLLMYYYGKKELMNGSRSGGGGSGGGGGRRPTIRGVRTFIFVSYFLSKEQRDSRGIDIF